ncbi:FAD-dependent oxidoreductase [Phytoactinopolyspora halotolerans]|uniref:Lysine N(6)-hydroxylase/L-ornithine N(5)-oxygenase family protein n=1 Tax=Phytoactinopolyspora halotolerans TaxID=1981512 RepID=A0A6L9SIC4_9ACTN|nr:FAD-dependent oxidoreductase [Phytoactinopolyspora halotolerans]NEE04414.1 lysine N(6)-hydroxylase/L-ornithine N(5)-oxygenase family protein [Phytoactinopolyspora halotolerans]
MTPSLPSSAPTAAAAVEATVHSDETLPVVVVGAGPIGLAAAAHLLERGLDPLVLEAGDEAGAAVAQWHHVRLFSPWSELIDPAAERLLKPTGWRAPDAGSYPTGTEWADQYLRPLAAALGDRVQLGARVVGVARRGRDLVVDAGRDSEPLTVHVASADGEQRIVARAVVDASGTWSRPNPLGGDGLPATGERTAAERIAYRIPNLDDEPVRARYAGKRVAVAGSGHSALTALVALAAIAEDHPSTEILWLLRRGTPGDVFGGGDADQLPARGALGLRAKAAAEAGHVRTVTGFRTAAVYREADGRLALESFDGQRLDPVDEVVVLTGFRPDLNWLSEVRLDLDPVLQAPRALAPLIDPNVHSCGTVYPHGVTELSQPEPGVYLVGMKSYGRAPTFLAMTGYEQVRSVAAALAGDREAAERVELTLPETGVCGGSGLFDEVGAEGSDAGCCGPAGPVEVTLGTRLTVGSSSS